MSYITERVILRSSIKQLVQQLLYHEYHYLERHIMYYNKRLGCQVLDWNVRPNVALKVLTASFELRRNTAKIYFDKKEYIESNGHSKFMRVMIERLGSSYSHWGQKLDDASIKVLKNFADEVEEFEEAAKKALQAMQSR